MALVRTHFFMKTRKGGRCSRGFFFGLVTCDLGVVDQKGVASTTRSRRPSLWSSSVYDIDEHVETADVDRGIGLVAATGGGGGSWTNAPGLAGSLEGIVLAAHRLRMPHGSAEGIILTISMRRGLRRTKTPTRQIAATIMEIAQPRVTHSRRWAWVTLNSVIVSVMVSNNVDCALRRIASVRTSSMISSSSGSVRLVNATEGACIWVYIHGTGLTGCPWISIQFFSRCTTRKNGSASITGNPSEIYEDRDFNRRAQGLSVTYFVLQLSGRFDQPTDEVFQGFRRTIRVLVGVLFVVLS